jgi:predicted GNAT family acetyltransferase
MELKPSSKNHFDIFENSKKIGNISYKDEGDFIELKRLNIDSDFQKKGFGSNAVKDFVELFPDRVIEVTPADESVGFWEKQPGFHWDVRKIHMLHQQKKYQMTKYSEMTPEQKERYRINKIRRYHNIDPEYIEQIKKEHIEHIKKEPVKKSSSEEFKKILREYPKKAIVKIAEDLIKDIEEHPDKRFETEKSYDLLASEQKLKDDERRRVARERMRERLRKMKENEI